MGVQGLTTLLIREGLMPPSPCSDDSSCSLPLWWRHEGQRDGDFRGVSIPKRSILAIDGDGLAHHLYRVAYSRYFEKQVAVHAERSKSRSSSSSSSSSPSSSSNRSSRRAVSSSAAICSTCVPSTVRKRVVVSEDLVTRLLPTSIPLGLLDEVTREFVDTLVQNDYALEVYWDGEGRRFKAETTQKRRETRTDEFSTLQQYCDYGILPSLQSTRSGAKQSHGCLCQDVMHRSFPSSRLCKAQVRHTLSRFCGGNIEELSSSFVGRKRSQISSSSVRVFQCLEEADREVAWASASRSNCYSVGLDSDYCLFPNCQYIPLTSLHFADVAIDASSSSNADCIHSQSLRGCLITRQYLTENVMDLPSEHLLVEVAIMTGNDYVMNGDADGALLDYQLYRQIHQSQDADDDTGRNHKRKKKDQHPAHLSLEDILDFLRHQSRSSVYQAWTTSGDPHVQRAIDFTRALYNFQPLDEFPLDEEEEEEEEEEDDEEDAERDNNDLVFDRPELPTELDLALAIPNPLDYSFVDVIKRPMQAYVDCMSASAPAAHGGSAAHHTPPRRAKQHAKLTQAHLDALEELSTQLQNPTQLHQYRQYGQDGSTGVDNNSIPLTNRARNGRDNFQDSSDTGVGRPFWEDVVAAYIIERVSNFVLETNPTAPIVRYASPDKVFENYHFHQIMKKTRAAAAAAASAAAADKALEEEKKESEATKIITPESTIERSTKSEDTSPASTMPSQPAATTKPSQRVLLPIDEYEADILEAVERNRVTIIHGETGCGKSSRVPVMLLRAPPPGDLADVKIFISQPRRIAAKALVERVRSCEPDLKDRIALRMGHGVREYESNRTRAWFVTTGYLVRLLANHPETFDRVSHLIIDEVHERSVDTDVLCLLCRRLLETNQRIRLLLMSATLAADMYASYFDVPEPPIHVGARRFPIQEHYIESLSRTFRLPPSESEAARFVENHCDKNRCKSAPANTYMEKLFKLSVRIATAAGKPGSSVLIFVPGMNEIISIIDLIEKVHAPGIRYTCFPIHSDIPFDEQMCAFDSPDDDEVKIVIATNAAESSITLPDVDHVICLGLCRQIVYNPMSHRQMLTAAWISRASAVQRAGRTGRVRPGNVYRLYTKRAFDNFMDKFETGEMLRTPLDTVILSLKNMLQEEATPILLQCLEPPDLSTIERSFESLHRNNFITEPNDDSHITPLGNFVSGLGIDLSLGSLVGLGIQFGVGKEAIEIAAVMSFPQSPWLMTNPLFHEPKEFNDITARTFVSKCHFDAKLYSEPLAAMNLMYDFERDSNQKNFAWQYAISLPRLRRLVTTRNSLRNRVADFVGIDADTLKLDRPPSQFPEAKLAILRIIQVWVFSDSMIDSIQVCSEGIDSVAIALRGKPIEEKHLEQILDPERHPFKLVTNCALDQSGKFSPVSEDRLEIHEFLRDFEERFISLAMTHDYHMMWYDCQTFFALLVPQSVEATPSFVNLRNTMFEDFEATYVVATENESPAGRGRCGRACGLWSVTQGNAPDASITKSDSKSPVVLLKLSTSKKRVIKGLGKRLKMKGTQLDNVEKLVGCQFMNYASGKDITYNLSLTGQATSLPTQDITDLMATPNLTVRTFEKVKSSQEVRFWVVDDTKPYRGKGGKARVTPSAVNVSKGVSSWKNPLLPDIPEGARILSVLASSRRRDHSILFPDLGDDSVENEESDPVIHTVELSKSATKIGERWKRMGSNSAVYVNECTVPAAALFMSGATELYACCANTLEIKGGGIRAEGLTLLPPGRMFVLLSFLSFGMRPFTDSNDDLTQASLDWLEDWNGQVQSLGLEHEDLDEDFSRHRIKLASEFHHSCKDLGEELMCYPDKVHALLKIFNKVSGHENLPWSDLSHDPFVATKENHILASDVPRNGSKQSKQAEKKQKQKQQTPKSQKQKRLEALVVENFSKGTQAELNRLFLLDLNPGESVSDADLPSTNILALIVRHWCQIVLDRNLMPEDRQYIEEESLVSYTDKHWVVYQAIVEGTCWYFADYIGEIMPLLSFEKKKKPIPHWMKKGLLRPTSPKEAFSCVPEQFSGLPSLALDLRMPDYSMEKAVAFGTIELAMRMGAAFWLERQFGNGSRHWFQHSLDEMIAKGATVLPEPAF